MNYTLRTQGDARSSDNNAVLCTTRCCYIFRLQVAPEITPLTLNVSSLMPLLQGTHQMIVQRDPFDDVAEQLALGILAGLAAGAAMRSFLWMPFFFCWDDPCYWHDNTARGLSVPTDWQPVVSICREAFSVLHLLYDLFSDHSCCNKQLLMFFFFFSCAILHMNIILTTTLCNYVLYSWTFAKQEVNFISQCSFICCLNLTLLILWA